MTRRGLLAAGGVLALSGCGADAADDEAAKPGTSETGRRADIELLDGLLAMEELSLAVPDLPEDIARQERAHADALEQVIRAARGAPSNRFLKTPPKGSAAEVKQTAIAAYMDALPKLSDERHRRLVASILAVEGEHLATLTAQLGAFVTGRKGRYLP